MASQRHHRNRSILLVFSTAIFLLFAAARSGPSAGASTQSETRATSNAPEGEKAALVSRGKYLVEGVAMCGTCHTPPGISGEPDRSQWLMGAPVGVTLEHPNPNWPTMAPRLASTPPGTDAEMIALLTTGIWKTGKPLRPPMPRFHMTQRDAEAVVAYLKSVKPAEPAAVPSYERYFRSPEHRHE